MKLRLPRAVLVILAATLVALGTSLRADAPKPMSPQPPLLPAPLQVVVVSDEGGARPARVDSKELAASVEFANRTFADAGIRFDFSLDRDVSAIESSLLNDLGSPPIPDWSRVKRVGERVAAKYPGKIVVLMRHGPGDHPAGNGFAGLDHSFIVMPGTLEARHCGHPHTDALAHEIGHYLGLSHTFVGDPFPDLAAAEAHFTRQGRDPAVFDGDGLRDTPPDPAIRELECQRVDEVTLSGVSFRLPRHNIMSYYDERSSLSPEQARRSRWMLEARLAAPATMRPVNDPGPAAIPAEAMEIVQIRDATTSVQSMTGFGVGDWSGDAHLFVGAGESGELTLRFRQPAPGRLWLYATRAPDFGRVRLFVDDEQLPAPIDLYAPAVLPTGAISLGDRLLEAGEHRLILRVAGRNPASTGHAFGIDAVAWD